MCCTSGRVTGSRTTSERSEAIRHAIAGHHYARAAELVELAVPALLRDRQEAMLRGWIELLPEELLQVRPVLSNGYVAALLSTGTIEGVDRHLQDAERWLERTRRPRSGDRGAAGRMVVADEAEFRRLPAGLAVHRAGLALVLGDLPGTVTHAQRALRALRRGRRCRAWSGHRADRARVLDERRSRGSPRGVHRVHGEDAASGTPVRRTRVLDHAGGHPDHPGPAPRRDAHLRARPAGRARAQQVRCCEAPPTCTSGWPRSTASTTTSGSPGSCWRGPRSWASTPGCRRTGIAGGSRWLASAWPRETSTPPSTCWTRRNGCTRLTSLRTCVRSRPSGRACWSRRAAGTKR